MKAQSGARRGLPCATGTRHTPSQTATAGRSPSQRREAARVEACASASVDYRLLPRWTASQRRQEKARQALPLTWRTDPRPEAQLAHEYWVGLLARTHERTVNQMIDGSSAIAGFPLDDR